MPTLALLRESRTAIQIITNMFPQVKRLLNEFSENIFVGTNNALFWEHDGLFYAKTWNSAYVLLYFIDREIGIKGVELLCGK
jgi:hypothetical protein